MRSVETRLAQLERNRPRHNVIRVIDGRGLTDEEIQAEKERIYRESGDDEFLIVIIDQ